jgi:hypothetical protein
LAHNAPMLKHDALSIYKRLLVYASDLRYEWSWKRGKDNIHKAEYDDLQKTIEDGYELQNKLEGIDNHDKNTR